MDAVILMQHYIADFVTPTPTTTRHTFEEALATLRETPPDIIRDNVQKLNLYEDESEIRQHFLAYPHEALECLIEELRLYWTRALAHHWANIQTTLENEIVYQGREMALRGVDAMFCNLDPSVCYQDKTIKLMKEPQKHLCPPNLRLDGRGLQLVPTAFPCTSVSWQIEPEWTPMIIYGARGAGLWYRKKLIDPETALGLALGAGRASVLVALQEPSSTGELARRLHVTAGAASQQLARLQEAGLVEPQRVSHRVYYHLTERGAKLIELFTA
jgi:DNA-binding transcriptional ArsR family regulator